MKGSELMPPTMQVCPTGTMKQISRSGTRLPSFMSRTIKLELCMPFNFTLPGPTSPQGRLDWTIGTRFWDVAAQTHRNIEPYVYSIALPT